MPPLKKLHNWYRGTSLNDNGHDDSDGDDEKKEDVGWMYWNSVGCGLIDQQVIFAAVPLFALLSPGGRIQKREYKLK